MPNRVHHDPSAQGFGRLAAWVALVFALIGMFVAYQLLQGHQRVLLDAEQTSQRHALLLDNYLHAHFQAVALTLASADAELAQLRRQQRLNDAEFNRLLQSLQRRVPGASGLRATDADGLVRFGRGVDQAQLLSVAERQFFRAARAAPADSVVFGLPLRSRISGQWVLPVARALRDDEGRFQGVAYVLTDTAQIAALFASLDIGSRGVVTLFDAQRQVLIRHPPAPGVTSDEQVVLLQATQTVAAMAAGRTEASYRTESSVDGIDRNVSYRRIGALPLYVIAGVARDDYLAPWRREVLYALSFICLLGLTALVACGMLWRGWHRRELAMALLVAKDDALRQSMAALGRSEERFRTLTNGLPQMVWTSRPDGSAEFFSHRWTEYTGLDATALLHAPTRHALMHPDELPALLAAWQQSLADGRPFHMLCRVRRHDGVWRVFDSRALPQCDADGHINAWIGSATDITEAHQLHDALLQAKQAADAASRAKSAFLATISHEIRTPLNGVLGFAHIGLREAEPGSRSALHFQRIQGSGQVLAALIDDVLDFSKIEAGKLQMDDAPVALHALLAEVVALLQPRADQQGITLALDLQPGCPAYCRGDALRLRQVLMNLLSNAVKFTTQGGVTLAAGRDGDVLWLRITDSGIGMTEAQLGRLFQPFEQADSSTTRRFGGTGLGLAITHRLVTLMDGSIHVTSQPGAGSCFEVRLACRPPADGAAAAAPPTLATAGGGNNGSSASGVG